MNREPHSQCIHVEFAIAFLDRTVYSQAISTLKLYADMLEMI